MILLRSSIGKFGFSLPAPFLEERARWVSQYLPEILNHPFFVIVGDFSFIRGSRKHECTCFKTDRARFYCPLRLEIVGYSNKSLWIRLSLHMTRFRIIRRLISIFRFHLKCFVCLTFRYYEFLEYSVSLARLGTSFIYMWIVGTSKIVLLFSFVRFKVFWKVLLNAFTRDNNIHPKKKGKTLVGPIAHLPIDSRWRSNF